MKLDPLKFNIQSSDLYGPVSLSDSLGQTTQLTPGGFTPTPGYGPESGNGTDPGNGGGPGITFNNGVGGSTISASTNDNSNNGINVNNPSTVNINQFGAYRAKPYMVYKIDLTTAGNNSILITQGTMLFCVWGSTWTAGAAGLLSGTRGEADPACRATVRIGSVDSDEIPFGPGFQLSGAPFRQLFFSWPAQANKVLEIYLTNDQPIDRIDAGS